MSKYYLRATQISHEKNKRRVFHTPPSETFYASALSRFLNSRKQGQQLIKLNKGSLQGQSAISQPVSKSKQCSSLAPLVPEVNPQAKNKFERYSSSLFYIQLRNRCSRIADFSNTLEEEQCELRKSLRSQSRKKRKTIKEYTLNFFKSKPITMTNDIPQKKISSKYFRATYDCSGYNALEGKNLLRKKMIQRISFTGYK